MNPQETQPDLYGGHRGVESPAGYFCQIQRENYFI
jgi:hypothetical protein